MLRIPAPSPRGKQGPACSWEASPTLLHLGDGRLDRHGMYAGHGGMASLAGHCGEKDVEVGERQPQSTVASPPPQATAVSAMEWGAAPASREC